MKKANRFVTSLSAVALSVTSLATLADLADKQPDSSSAVVTDAGTSLQVYKSPTCGCCEDWISHVNKHGITTEAYNSNRMGEIKDQLGNAPSLRSCHTAVSANGYVFEGHVPARYVEAFMANPPAGAIGLSVPAMPIGSPGMEMGDRFMPYQVVQLNTDGSSLVYANINSAADQ